jgi:hypothetical protein
MAHKLYSLNGEYPTRLGRIRMPDGTTRTDGTTFTPEEIELAGYTGPYYEPEYDSNNQYLEWDGEKLEFTVEDYPADRFLSYLRERRSEELRKTDWTQLKDCPLTSREISGWAAYRQTLRNLPEDLTSIPSSTEEVNEILQQILDSKTNSSSSTPAS